MLYATLQKNRLLFNMLNWHALSTLYTASQFTLYTAQRNLRPRTKDCVFMTSTLGPQR